MLPDERDYTNALSLSRLAYDLESLLSPMLAAALLTVISFHALFAGTSAGFLLSAAFVVSVLLPSPKPRARRGIWTATTHGARLYLATPRLRGLLALTLAAAAASAMVIVNTVVLVQAQFGLGPSQVALALAAYGGGSMAAALTLPRVLERVGDRPVMLSGAALLANGMLFGPLANDLTALLPLWLLLGLGYSLTLTPSGRLLRRSAHPEDRPALFAAQFALSHACWLLTYPLAGRLGTAAGLSPTFLIMAAVALIGIFVATRLWPKDQADAPEHRHANLHPGHAHLVDHPVDREGRHVHPFVIDDLHLTWPRGA